ncbi:histone arginine methyltransferase prmt5 [Cystoisospora suis]|uniref:Histone arginine methyltransferase prmt5 n=1 Tax=Cystoisospora suis TaxID=483139 RepID=A0A2C6KY97_9APIC|nr:histone arginine methyltransferase prmt5 [Cystoisospora suis]
MPLQPPSNSCLTGPVFFGIGLSHSAVRTPDSLHAHLQAVRNQLQCDFVVIPTASASSSPFIKLSQFLSKKKCISKTIGKPSFDQDHHSLSPTQDSCHLSSSSSSSSSKPPSNPNCHSLPSDGVPSENLEQNSTTEETLLSSSLSPNGKGVHSGLKQEDEARTTCKDGEKVPSPSSSSSSSSCGSSLSEDEEERSPVSSLSSLSFTQIPLDHLPVYAANPHDKKRFLSLQADSPARGIRRRGETNTKSLSGKQSPPNDEQIKEAAHCRLSHSPSSALSSIDQTRELSFSKIDGGLSCRPPAYQFEPSTGSDLVLDSNTWASSIVCELSKWISPDCGINPFDPRLVHRRSQEKKKKKKNKKKKTFSPASTEGKTRAASDGKHSDEAIGSSSSHVQRGEASRTQGRESEDEEEDHENVLLSFSTGESEGRGSDHEEEEDQEEEAKKDEKRKKRNGGVIEDEEDGKELRERGFLIPRDHELNHWSYHVSAWQREIQWATHIGAYAVITPEPCPGVSPVEYSRQIRLALNQLQPPSIWVRLPLVYSSSSFHLSNHLHKTTSSSSSSSSLRTKDDDGVVQDAENPKVSGQHGISCSSCMKSEEKDLSTSPHRHRQPNTCRCHCEIPQGHLSSSSSSSSCSPWHQWNAIRSFVGYHQNLGICLQLTPDLPSEDEELDRWFAEPLRALLISPSCFTSSSSSEGRNERRGPRDGGEGPQQQQHHPSDQRHSSLKKKKKKGFHDSTQHAPPLSSPSTNSSKNASSSSSSSSSASWGRALSPRHFRFLARCAEHRVKLILIQDEEEDEERGWHFSQKEKCDSGYVALSSEDKEGAVLGQKKNAAGGGREKTTRTGERDTRRPVDISDLHAFPSLSSSGGNHPHRHTHTSISPKTKTCPSLSSPSSSSLKDRYQAYLSYIVSELLRLPTLSAATLFSAPYRDVLQSPMQPLADNLSTMNYEVFEKDPVKYVRYRQAILRRLTEIWRRKEEDEDDHPPSRYATSASSSIGRAKTRKEEKGHVEASGETSLKKHQEKKKMVEDALPSPSVGSTDKRNNEDEEEEEEKKNKKKEKKVCKSQKDQGGKSNQSKEKGERGGPKGNKTRSGDSSFFSSSSSKYLLDEYFGNSKEEGESDDGALSEEEEQQHAKEDAENLLVHQRGGIEEEEKKQRRGEYTWCLNGDDCPIHSLPPPEAVEEKSSEDQLHHDDADDKKNKKREKKNPKKAPIVIMVVGAGRGPLVQATLDALREAEIPLCCAHVYAVEKNSNAVITLRSKVLYDPCEGWRRVRVLESDMREVRHLVEERADILVSELLGSFGDNELSVECLHGAQQQLLKPHVGISIPTSYVSTLEPVSTSRLWTAIDSYGSAKHFESPYVVDFFAVYKPGVEGPKECFYFKHPDPILLPTSSSSGEGEDDETDEEDEDEERETEMKGERRSRRGDNNSNSNDEKAMNNNKKKNGEEEEGYKSGVRKKKKILRRRDKKEKQKKNRPLKCPLTQSALTLYRHRRTQLSWTMKTDTLVHGLAGYFHCCLYRDIYISIDPRSFSEGMFSWFPLFLPFRVPVYVRQNEQLEIYLAREGDDHRVWYEWAVVRPTPSELYNHFGKHYFIGK